MENETSEEKGLSFLESFEQRHNQVLDDLDELNQRIVRVLEEYLPRRDMESGKQPKRKSELQTGAAECSKAAPEANSEPGKDVHEPASKDELGESSGEQNASQVPSTQVSAEPESSPAAQDWQDSVQVPAEETKMAGELVEATSEVDSTAQALTNPAEAADSVAQPVDSGNREQSKEAA